MATLSNAGTTKASETIAALVAAEGSAAAPAARALCAPGVALRDLADAVHALCALHGTAPGLIEMAASENRDILFDPVVRDAADWFAAEREALATLTAAVGPLPSTPGQAESEAAITAQRHALATLARSGRAGCAIGAVLALVLDWAAVRRVLALSAERTSTAFDVPPLPAAHDFDRMLLSVSPGRDRAMLFGAQQLLAQHRGLWDLLDARASARRGS